MAFRYDSDAVTWWAELGVALARLGRSDLVQRTEQRLRQFEVGVQDLLRQAESLFAAGDVTAVLQMLSMDSSESDWQPYISLLRQRPEDSAKIAEVVSKALRAYRASLDEIGTPLVVLAALDVLFEAIVLPRRFLSAAESSIRKSLSQGTVVLDLADGRGSVVALSEHGALAEAAFWELLDMASVQWQLDLGNTAYESQVAPIDPKQMATRLAAYKVALWQGERLAA